jgi:hypothetical protein
MNPQEVKIRQRFITSLTNLDQAEIWPPVTEIPKYERVKLKWSEVVKYVFGRLSIYHYLP